MPQNKIVFIVGPTAVGKTDVGFFIARELGAEIISCDAMLVYREFDIVSGKPPLAMRQAVPHHLIDLVSVTQDFDVAQFNVLAQPALAGVLGRGRPVIVVGGSGMYMQILLDGIFAEKPRDQELRLALQKRIDTGAAAEVYAELKKADPVAAARIHPNDSRRIIRALEVFYFSQKPISDRQKDRQGWWGNMDIKIFALNRPRPQLYDRINRRVEQMFDQGLEKEIRALGSVKISRSAGVAIGVEEVRGYCAGKYTFVEATENMKMNTRRLAKRQLTWFRKDKRLDWVDIADGEPAADTGGRILQILEK
jgi:tRNA dimethylallyltransferase